MKIKITQFISDYYLYFALFLSFTATIGSLYMSQVLALTPCDLCWYQRIFMYASFAISLIGAVIKDEADTYKYLLGLAVPGLLISAYQYYIQKFPTSQFVIGGCSVANPCTRIDFELWGFVTIPLMSFVAFFVLTALCLIKMRVDRESDLDNIS